MFCFCEKAVKCYYGVVFSWIKRHPFFTDFLNVCACPLGFWSLFGPLYCHFEPFAYACHCYLLGYSLFITGAMSVAIGLFDHSGSYMFLWYTPRYH